MSSNARGILIRMSLCLLIGVLIGFALSEASFRLLSNETDRPVQTVELVIPAGTAEMVAAGKSNPALPQNMVFMTGDLLMVKNEDNVPHQLGPVWVPAGASGSLKLDTADSYAFACTFQPPRFQGLDVRASVTPATRIQAVIAVGLPTGGMLGVYSFVLFPLGGKKRKEDAQSA